MKYCVECKKDFNYYYLTKEVIINFEETNKLLGLIDLIKSNDVLRNKTIIIDCAGIPLKILSTALDNGVAIVNEARKQFKDIDIKFRLTSNAFYHGYNDYKEILLKLKEANISYFSLDIITNWETFNFILSLDISDIYIGYDLGFDLPNVSQAAHNKGVQIRVIPDLAQSYNPNTFDLKKFFIRPEDIKESEKYIDVFEFFNFESLNTIFKIYAIDQQWDDDLSILINGFNEPIKSHNLMPGFFEQRSKCKRKCLQGRSCHLCEDIAKVARIFEEQELTFSYEDNKEES